MITFDIPQDDPRWYELRIGKITASAFEECCRVVGGLTEQQQKYVDALQAGEDEKEALKVAGYKSRPRSGAIDRALKGEEVGDFSDQAKKYAKRLAFERVEGRLLGLDDQFETYAMRRGKELEGEARLAHEDEMNVLVQHCSFVMSDCERFGASADGFIGDEDVAEYKAFVDAEKIFRIRVEGDISDAQYQIQGQLWITGRKRARYCHYHPNMTPALVELVVERDEAFITKMADRLEKFDALVEQYREHILAARGEEQQEQAA